MNNIYLQIRGYYIRHVGCIDPTRQLYISNVLELYVQHVGHICPINRPYSSCKGNNKNKVTDEKRMLFAILSPYRNLFYLTLFRLFSDISKNTTIYVENMTVNSVRSFRSKEHGRTCQFFRIQPTTGMRLSADE